VEWHLVIEAGAPDTNWLLHLPLGVAKIWSNPQFTWSYNSDPEPHANGRQIYHPRGRVVGGSSSINIMGYVRGHRRDYDRWQQMGLARWSYADVLPYFQRSETFAGGADTYRGGDGALSVRKGTYQDPIFDAFMGAASHVGYATNDDYNGRKQEGFARFQFTARSSRRSSAATAFLHPARGESRFNSLSAV